MTTGSKSLALSGIAWLHDLPPWDGKNFSPLEIPKRLLEKLGNPQNSYQCIHIAGTNGKGSVAHYLSSILEEQFPNDKIGLMTSPHISVVEERAKINSHLCEPKKLSDVLMEVKSVCENESITTTYFVAITCAIFLLFKQEQVRYAVIETGLGGLYDATNVIENPALCIITSIGIDHEAQLGNTLESVATNKAGIIKNRVAVLCGNISPKPMEVITRVAKEKKSPLYTSQSFTSNSFSNELSELFGFIKENALTAFKAGLLLSCTEENIIRGIKKTKIPGRAELISLYDKTLLVDAAHNPDGIKEICLYTKELLEKHSFSSLTICLGFYKRKNWEKSLRVFRNFVEKEFSSLSLELNLLWYTFSEEAVDGKTLQETAQLKGNNMLALSEVEVFKAIKEAPKNSLLVFAGSFKILETVHNIRQKHNDL